MHRIAQAIFLMFNVYRFIFTTENATALTSALQTLLALATAEAQSAEKVTEEEM